MKKILPLIILLILVAGVIGCVGQPSLSDQKDMIQPTLDAEYLAIVESVPPARLLLCGGVSMRDSSLPEPFQRCLIGLKAL